MASPESDNGAGAEGAGSDGDGSAPRPPAHSMSEVYRATVKEATKEDFARSLATLHREPCLREAMSWGFGLGVLFALHRFKQSRDIIRSTNSFITVTGIASVGAWTLCRKNEVDKALDMRRKYGVSDRITTDNPLADPHATRVPTVHPDLIDDAKGGDGGMHR